MKIKNIPNFANHMYVIARFVYSEITEYGSTYVLNSNEKSDFQSLHVSLKNMPYNTEVHWHGSITMHLY